MTWLRSTAVAAFAASTIACTSGSLATPRFLATRVDGLVHTTSLLRTTIWATE